MVSDSHGTSGEGAYVRYEMLLRELESRTGSTVVVSGCFFAIRKTLCRDWFDGLTSDFYLPILSRKAGYRVLQDSNAICTYEAAQTAEKEYRRKVRTIVNGMDVLAAFNSILNPFRYGHFAAKMIQHKLLRWLVPFVLIAALLINICLLGDRPVYYVTLSFQVAMYTLAVVASLHSTLQEFSVFKIPLFFVLSNGAILVAWWKFLRGRSQTIWEPTGR